MENLGKRKLKFDYSWITYALCFLCIFVCLGFCSTGRTYYLTAITDALGFSRGDYSWSETIRYGVSTILNLYLGFFISKFGIKKLLCAGFVCLIGFAYTGSVASELWQFYLGAILLGIGLAWTSTAMMSAVVGIWCKKNKGTITGIILSANGLGGAVAVQIISPIIFDPNNQPFGYRNSYQLVTIILAVVLLLIILFFKEKPKGAEDTEIVVGKKSKKARGVGWVGMEYDQAKKKPYFYLAIIAIFLTGVSLNGISNVAAPHLYDLGFEKQFVANIGTVTSLCLMGTKIGIGFLYDRKGIKVTMNICFVCAFVSLGGLILLDNSEAGKVLAYARGIAGTIALPLETVMISIFASEIFGDKSFVKVLGVFSAANCAGLALGSPFVNTCYDLFDHSYNVSFAVLAAFMIVAMVTMNFVIRAAHKDKKLILDSLTQIEQKA